MEKSPVEQFVDDFQALIVAVIGSEMAKSGVISAYPEKYAKDIKIARKNLISFLESQGGDDLNDGAPASSRTLEVEHDPQTTAAGSPEKDESPEPEIEEEQPEKEPESEEVIPTDNDESEVELEDTDTDDQPEKGDEDEE